jgi:hypothetical protein
MKKVEPQDSVGNLINNFKKQFYNLTGVLPIIIYPMQGNYQNKIDLKKLSDLVNEIFKENFPDDYPENGISNRCRKRIIITFRQVYFKIGVEMGHTIDSIAKNIGYDHATVIHSRKNVSNLLEYNDPLTVSTYKKIKYATKERYGYDGDVQQDDRGTIISEPILPSILHERESISSNNKHSSDKA